MRTRTPQSIIIATITNAIMLFAFVICLLFTLGNLDQDTNTPTGVPLIEVYYQATGSKSATNFLVLMPVIVLNFGEFNVFASVSRLVWIFSKDNGLPFSKFFSTVSCFIFTYTAAKYGGALAWVPPPTNKGLPAKRPAGDAIYLRRTKAAHENNYSPSQTL